MSIAKTYNPHDTEDKWYAHWMAQDFFSSRPNPDKEPYTIVIPPPNVTGVLHMGHMLNNTLQDVLIRRARMQGKEACWVPGTDHASIATEAKVVKMLKDRGIEKSSLSREDFLKYAWEWKEKYGGIILEQLKKLGASCDWKRTKFTMDAEMSEQVLKVFVDWYRRGYIYRGMRMVNWDPQGKTALADDEVIRRDTASKLFYIRYQIADSHTHLVIATQRPETIFGDVAIAVHPDDERYKHLIGREALVPILKRAIPVIADAYVDMEFGTGCLKVTPAHDINDYEIGQRHQLAVLDTLDDEGRFRSSVLPAAEQEVLRRFDGTDRFALRKQLADEITAAGQMERVDENYVASIGYSERTDAVVEPKLSRQWFVAMKELCQPALQAVENDTVQLIPAKFKNTYRHWMENVRDWCISRQLWWGQRIPAWYLPNGEFVVALNEEEALSLARQQPGMEHLQATDLRQDEDVLDTWFSSGLWPISVFNGINEPENEEINYYYPTNDLVTAPEILFFWVARMIIAGYDFRGREPFKNVYLTGIVRDKLRRKMSKSLGNSPDPLELISQYGADGVRTGMLFSSPAGNDLLFDEKLCEQGRNFTNKIWNAFRLVKGWEVAPNPAQSERNQVATRWFEARFHTVLAEIEEHYERYRISDALMAVYKLIWDDFCAWYLEMIKPEYQQPIDELTLATTIGFFEDLMKVLHPFMPFISEEIWHGLADRSASDCVIVAQYPQVQPVSEAQQKLMANVALAFEIVSAVRNLRSQKGMSPREALDLFIKTDKPEAYVPQVPLMQKMANLSQIHFTEEGVERALSFVVAADECFIPVSTSINTEEEREKILKELEYTKGFLESVVKKLSNERFVANAKPDVVANERKKMDDAGQKIKALEAALAALS